MKSFLKCFFEFILGNKADLAGSEFFLRTFSLVGVYVALPSLLRLFLVILSQVFGQSVFQIVIYSHKIYGSEIYFLGFLLLFLVLVYRRLKSLKYSSKIFKIGFASVVGVLVWLVSFLPDISYRLSFAKFFSLGSPDEPLRTLLTTGWFSHLAFFALLACLPFFLFLVLRRRKL